MSGFQGKVPILMSTLLGVSILIGGYYRLNTLEPIMQILGGILIFLYLTWIVYEAKVALSEVKEKHTGIDKGTMEFYAFGRFATVIVSLIAPPLYVWETPLAVAFVLLFIIGIGFRLYGIHILGKFYSHRVRVKEGHQIISHGPYAFIRHPAYSGMLLGHLGFVMFFFSWFNFAVFAFLLLPSIIVRILIEEKVLYSIPGYTEYAKNRKRLIPLIW